MPPRRPASASCPARTRSTTTASRPAAPSTCEAVRSGAIPPGYAVDDGAALLFRGRELHEVVTARPRARAYAVDSEKERPLPARVLATPTDAPATLPAVAELRRLRVARAGGVRD